MKNWMECAEYGMEKNSILQWKPDSYSETVYRKFPALPMDGELRMGRGTFDRLSGIVNKKVPVERDWKQVRYKLFELMKSRGTFTERIQKMVKLKASVKIP